MTVPHLGDSTIGYEFARPYDASLPTLVLVNSFTTSTELYRPQFADDDLTAAANLLAIELYGHGRTRTTFPQFTIGTRRSRTSRFSMHSRSIVLSSSARHRVDGSRQGLLAPRVPQQLLG